MNVIDVFQKCLVYACLAGAAVCFFAVLAYHFRDQLRELHERWLGLGPLGRVVSILAVTLAVLYGGTKSPTNEVTGGGATGTGTTGVSPVAGCAVARSTGATGVSPVAGWGPNGQDARWPSVSNGQDARWPSASADGQDARWPSVSDGQDAHRPSALRPMAGQMAMSPQPTNQPPNPQTNWALRGAFSDWQRIDFPESFAFPHGTNLLTSITLFAYGEIRESLHQLTTNNQQLTTLPTAVSLEPNVSSCAYGLTPSNSFLIAWQNACVNRDATNRVDASIELFRNGAIVITTQRPGETPSINYQAPITPPGFIGSNQDNDWALAAFPDDYDAITNKGYEAWLMEDKVGINEQNGICKVSITIDQQPSTNNQQPIYLVCGPYKVTVTQPGTYSFPLRVLTRYKARTYPIDLPLTIEIDDGYRSDEPPSLLGAPSRARLLSSRPVRFHEYEIYLEPRVYITPAEIPFSQAEGAHVSIWCNVANAVWEWYTDGLEGIDMVFHDRSDAELHNIIYACEVILICEQEGVEITGRFYINPPPWEPTPNSTNDTTTVEGTNSNASASEP